MIFHVFKKTELERLFEILSYNSLIGPTRKAISPTGRPIYLFEHLYGFRDLEVDYSVTVHSAKKYFFPHKQQLAAYTLEDTVWHKEVKPEETVHTVFFGMHPCDINALNRLDRILLDGAYPDLFYAARRRNTFIVGVGCKPQPHCFCRSMGCDTVLHGCDLFLTDLGEDYFCEIRSGIAFEVMQGLSSKEADSSSHAKYVRISEERKNGFSCHVETTDLTRILDMEFQAEVWQDWGKRCLSCGTCASVCPTCYCYGTEHTIGLNLKEAAKEKKLYSCNIVDFAEVAGGHNFRPSSDIRLKYRYYHKHRGFVEAFEESLCVGCGRCGISCLAGITVPDVISSVRKEVSEYG